MSVKLYGEVDMPENAEDVRLDRIILYTLGKDDMIRLEDVRAINFAENDYRGYISAGGNQTSGNTKTEAVNMSGNLMYRKLEHRYNCWMENIIAPKPMEKTRPITAAFTIKYDYFLTRRVYVGGLNLAETDQFQNLSLRNTSALILGYDIARPGTSQFVDRCRPGGRVSGLHDGPGDYHTLADLPCAVRIHVPGR